MISPHSQSKFYSTVIFAVPEHSNLTTRTKNIKQIGV